MAFISYSQNFEDIILWRALKHIECGFYIDVGANDPEIDSVTKAFYDRGWRGINIEPVAQWYEKLVEARVRDINLQLAVGAEKGDLILYELPDTGLSTLERSIAERHEVEQGYTKFERVVPVETITTVCQQYHIAPIHFLKIDVEGAEKEAVRGIDFSIIQPWIIVIESTLPLTQIEDYENWESTILSANYEYVYFDGLNRFYISKSHDDLKCHFYSPPNIFDGFLLSGVSPNQPFCNLFKDREKGYQNRVAEQEGRAQAAEHRAAEQEGRAQAAEHRAAEQESRAQAAEHRAAEQEGRVQAAEHRAAEQESRVQAAEHRAAEQESRVQAAEHRALEQENRAILAELRVQEEISNAAAINKRQSEQSQSIQELKESTHHWWVQASALEAERNALRQSWSWRITAPVRWGGRLAISGHSAMGLVANRTLSLTAAALQYPLIKLMRAVLRYPDLSYRINQRLLRYPALHDHLLHKAQKAGLMPAIPIMSAPTMPQQFITPALPSELSCLSPQAQEIYADLKAAIEERRKVINNAYSD